MIEIQKSKTDDQRTKVFRQGSFGDVVTTLWTWVRYGTAYVSFPLSVYSTAALTLVLFPKEFWLFLTLGSGAVVGVDLFFGWLHFNTAYKKDSQIAAEKMPYNFKAQPGISIDLQIPTQIIVLKTMRKIADKEDFAHYDYLIKIWEGLGEGKDLRALIQEKAQKGLE